MTTAAELPLGNRAQTFRITLGTKELTLTQRWNAPAGAWLLDVADSAGNALLTGLLLVTGADLWSQFEHLGLGGALVVQTDGNEDEVPSYSSLGITGHAYYVTA